MLIDYWTQGNFADKIFIILGVLFILGALGTFFNYLDDNANKRLKFIETCLNEESTAIGKISCYTLHYKKGYPSHYEIEYCYVVNDEPYFLTYKMALEPPVANSKSEFNADVVLSSIHPFLILYYDKKNPYRVMCKEEIFTSKKYFSKTKSARVNRYRDRNKQWSEPIRIGR